MEQSTTIGLNKITRERLKDIGKKGEKYDSIVLRLLEYYNNHGGKVKESSPLSDMN